MALAVLGLALLAPQSPSYAKPSVRVHTVPIVGKSHATLRLVEFATRSALCDLAEKKVAEAENRFAKSWVREALELIGELPDYRNRLYYQCDTSLKFDSPQLLSVWSFSDHYSGGAHGMRNTRTYNFGMVHGKPARFGVAEAFLRDKASRTALQELLVGRARLLEGTDWIAEGTVKFLSDDQLSRFWVDRDALVWEFDPYELGPYYRGTFTLRIPRMDLVKLINIEGPLRNWAGL